MATVDINPQVSSSLYSTNVNTSLLLRNFLSTELAVNPFGSDASITNTPPSGLYLDALDPRATRLLASIKNFTPYRWRKGDKIFNVAYRFHGTTSTAWIILGVNPVTSTFDLIPGLPIRIPDFADIMQYLQSLKTPTVQKTYVAF